MREIKFKVWDKNKNVFIPEDVYAIINRPSFNAFGVMITDWQDYKEGEYFYNNAQELVLFTGLKDRNGVEIFEGDVVKYHDHPTGIEDGVGKVYYKDGKWMVTWSIIPLGDFGTAWVEVIGNIYQNPELLTTPNRG